MLKIMMVMTMMMKMTKMLCESSQAKRVEEPDCAELVPDKMPLNLLLHEHCLHPAEYGSTVCPACCIGDQCSRLRIQQLEQ